MQKLLRLFSVVLALVISLPAVAQGKYFEFYSATGMEAEFSFDAEVIAMQAKAPTRDQVDGLVRKQMRYMLGPMRSRKQNAAALYPKWSFTVLGVKKGPAGWRVKYNLKSKGEFKKGTSQYTFTLPYNPNTLFRDAAGKCMLEAAQESNFWYHWEPLMSDCGLKESVHFYNVTAQLTPKASSTKTYPEYSRLVDASKTIKITMLFGLAEYASANWTPDGGDDWGIKAYTQQREFLKSKGFTERQWTQQEVEAVYPSKAKKLPYVLEMTAAGAVAKLRIRLVLADTGFSHDSLAFHYFLKDSLAKESVIIYNGHSGIGKNLDIPAIEQLRGFKMPISTDYQILFLGSCLPYAYYPEIFFNKKRSAADPNGTKNLDIFTYGEAALYGSKEDQLLIRALLHYAKDGGRVSYQTIVDLGPHFLFAINGDEDNPTQ